MTRSRLWRWSWRWGWLLLLVAGLVLLPGTGLLLHLAYGALHRSFGMAVDLASIALVLVLVVGFFAPLEAMGWWAGWFGEEMAPADSIGQLATTATTERIGRWVVYLDGIGQASLEAQPEGEDFLRQLAATLPADIAIIRGIMPYSVVNQPITEGSWVATFWRWVDWLRLRHPRSLLGAIINLRNLAVVAVSADPRYGPIYNRGTAKVIADSLLANGYPLASRTPVTLMGFSGGGQIALGALPHLRRLLAAPVEVISLAGVFSGGNAFLVVDHLFHLVGELDPVERIGPVVFPGRWRPMALSYWNRARRRGKVTLISLGQVGHELPGGIFDTQVSLSDGRTPMQQTLDLVSAILTGRLGATAPPVAGPSNYERFGSNPWHQIMPVRDTMPLPSPVLRPSIAGSAGWCCPNPNIATLVWASKCCKPPIPGAPWWAAGSGSTGRPNRCARWRWTCTSAMRRWPVGSVEPSIRCDWKAGARSHPWNPWPAPAPGTTSWCGCGDRCR
jgi:hypothetical protein